MFAKSLLYFLLLTLCMAPGFAQDKPSASPYLDLIKDAGDSKDYEDSNTLLVFDSTWVDVDSTGLSHKRTHTLTKVLTPAGIAALRAVRFNYDPASNTIDLLTAKVHRSDGAVEQINIERIVDAPQPTHLIYWGARMKVLPIPPLEVGDAVEFEYMQMGFQIAYLTSDGVEEKYIPPMRGTYYDVIMFGSSILEEETPPIKLKSYTITMPLDKPAQFETYNGDIKSAMLFGEGRYVYHFWKEDVPGFSSETRAPGPTDIVPKVVFTNVKSWAEKSRWFYDVNEDAQVFEADDAIKREVARITKGCTTDTCKFYALLHWVAQEIRYSGISMGIGEGFTLHPGTMTFRDRAGVCKDIAGMLVTMLRVAGYTTYPVMTEAGARVERIPADQFNHCVVAVKRPDGSFLMLDPTWTPFNMELWSRAESEQHYVVGSPEGEELSQIAKYTPEENDFSFKMKTRLDEDGNLAGSVTLQGKAQADARVRRPFSDAGRNHWDEVCRAWLYNADHAAELTKVTYGDLWDFYTPFAVTLEFRVPDYARRLGNRLDYVPFSSRLLWAGGYQMNLLSGLTAKERTQPILTYNPRQVTLQEALALPVGMSVRKMPDALDEGGEAAWTKGGWKKSGAGLELNYVWHVKERWIPVSDYADVKAATDAIKDYDKVALVIEKGGK